MHLAKYKWAPVLAALALLGCSGTSTTGGTLTTVRAVSALTPTELKSSRLVRLRGTLTYASMSNSFYFLSDETGGIRLDLLSPGKTQAVYGDEVEVTGIAVPGSRSPSVGRAQIAVLGKGRLPKPEEAHGPDLVTGRYESRRITVHGILMRSRVSDEESKFDSRELHVRVDQEFAVVRIENDKRWEDTAIDSEVQVTGVISSMVDARGVTTRSIVWAAELGAVEFTSKPPGVASLPIRTVKDLLAMDAAQLPRHRIRMRGKLINAPNSNVLEDETGRLLIRGDVPSENPEQRIDLMGFVAPRNGQISIQDVLPVLTPEASAVAQGPNAKPLMTSAQAIHRLPLVKASSRYPVRLTGVVTYHNLHSNLLFVEDATDGIFVWPKGLDRQLSPGDLIRIEGHTSGNGFAPFIGADSVTPVAHGPLPEPARGMEEQAFQGHLDSRWLEMRGVVQSVADNILTIAWGTHTFEAQIYQPSHPLGSLTGAEIVVQGVSSSLTNKRRQFLGLTLQVASEKQIQVIHPGPENPFLMPVRFSVDLMAFSPTDTADRRARVRGVVTLVEPGGTLWLRDASGGVEVQQRSVSTVAAGDLIDASGLPAAGAYSVVLRDADIRRVGTGPRPEPLHFDPAGGFKPEMDAQLVRIDATLLNDASSPDGPVMLLQAGSIPFQAKLMAANEEGETMPPPGSLLRLAGVYSVDPAESAEKMTRGFHLIIGSKTDIQILRGVSWWTPARLTGVILLGFVVIVASVAWVVLLRRQVRARVAEAEAAADRAATAERNEARQKQVLDLIARHATVETIAGHLAASVEGTCPGLRCSVVILRPEGELPLAAGAVPDDLKAALQGFGMGEIIEGRRPRALPGADLPAAWYYLSFPVVVNNEIRGSINLFAPGRQPLDLVAADTLVTWVNLAAMTVERRDLHDRLSFRAAHDPLTELPNRLTFEERLQAEIERSTEPLRPFALCYVDLDYFKTINDTLGHDVGDVVLKEVAARMRTLIRPSDTAARLGGDEFVVMLQAIGERVNAEEFAVQMTASLRQPIRAGGHMVNMGMSIGISLFPEDGRDATTLLRRADTEMYREKHGREGRSVAEISSALDLSRLTGTLELV